MVGALVELAGGALGVLEYGWVLLGGVGMPV